jgi:hypothetical protein
MWASFGVTPANGAVIGQGGLIAAAACFGLQSVEETGTAAAAFA